MLLYHLKSFLKKSFIHHQCMLIYVCGECVYVFDNKKPLPYKVVAFYIACSKVATFLFQALHYLLNNKSHASHAFVRFLETIPINN